MATKSRRQPLCPSEGVSHSVCLKSERYPGSEATSLRAELLKAVIGRCFFLKAIAQFQRKSNGNDGKDPGLCTGGINFVSSGIEM